MPICYAGSVVSRRADNPADSLGGITSRTTMDTATRPGFRFIAMARALLAEPGLVSRIAAERQPECGRRAHTVISAWPRLSPHSLCGHRGSTASRLTPSAARNPVDFPRESGQGARDRARHNLNRSHPPVLTVRSDQSQQCFAAGRDVVVRGDLRADMRVAHPLIARAHLLLRASIGAVVAIDNDSQSGMFVDGQRVSEVDIATVTPSTSGSPRALGSPWSAITRASSDGCHAPRRRVPAHRSSPLPSFPARAPPQRPAVGVDAHPRRGPATIPGPGGAHQVRRVISRAPVVQAPLSRRRSALAEVGIHQAEVSAGRSVETTQIIPPSDVARRRRSRQSHEDRAQHAALGKC